MVSFLALVITLQMVLYYTVTALTISFQLWMEFRRFFFCFLLFLSTLQGGRYNALIPWSPPSIQRLNTHSLLQRVLSLHVLKQHAWIPPSAMLQELSNILGLHIVAVQFCFRQQCSSPWNHSIFCQILQCIADCDWWRIVW
jgi:hypothetical protein